jgi:hypothetical protein
MKKSMEEIAYPKMKAILDENGLQITLKTLIDSLQNLIDERGKTLESVIILETLRGLHAGYLRRYEVKDDIDILDHNRETSY